MQRAYMSKLMELAEKDRNILHLVADNDTGFDELFARYFSDQIYNFGIAEEHMVAASAGMATAGKTPFVYTNGAFLAYRSLEFIRDDICLQNLNVKLVGMGSGLSISALGPTHHTTEDIAILRTIPNLMILSAATPLQVAACVEEAYRHQGPVYIRIGMNNEKEYFNEDYQLSLLGQDAMLEGDDVTIFTTGSILEEVMDAADILAREGISATVVNVAIVKPFCEEKLLEKMDKTKLIVSVEEHNILGGLGSILSEAMTKHGSCKKLLRIGLNDMFAEGYSNSQKILRKQNHLDAASIAKSIMEKL